MTSVLGAHKAAEEFAAALDGRLPASRLRPELAPLVGLTQELGAVAPPPQRTGFHDQLRDRLMTEAVQGSSGGAATAGADPAGPPRPTTGAGRRRLGALLVLGVLAGGVVAAGVAARDALPGEPLYGVKRAVEEAHMILTSGEPGQEHLELAAVRLHEAGVLLETSADARSTSETLVAFHEQLEAAAQEVTTAYRADGDPASVEALTASAAESLVTLDAYAEDAADPALEARVRDVATAVARIHERARSLCSGCDPGAPRAG